MEVWETSMFFFKIGLLVYIFRTKKTKLKKTGKKRGLYKNIPSGKDNQGENEEKVQDVKESFLPEKS